MSNLPLALPAMTWVAYPANFFLSEQGLDVWGGNTSTKIYAVADIVAKPTYSFVFLGGLLAIERRAREEADRPEEHMKVTGRARHEAGLVRASGDRGAAVAGTGKG